MTAYKKLFKQYQILTSRKNKVQNLTDYRINTKHHRTKIERVSDVLDMIRDRQTAIMMQLSDLAAKSKKLSVMTEILDFQLNND